MKDNPTISEKAEAYRRDHPIKHYVGYALFCIILVPIMFLIAWVRP